LTVTGASAADVRLFELESVTVTFTTYVIPPPA
jgi:hypothetical protein